jgi:hypothetical protein
LRPGHHERLFVRQGHRLSRINRGPSPGKASTSNNGRHDNVNFRQLRYFLQSLRANEQLGLRRQPAPVEPAGILGVGGDNKSRFPALGLNTEVLKSPMCRQGNHLKLRFGAGDHFQRALADAPRGAEEGNAAWSVVHTGENANALQIGLSDFLARNRRVSNNKSDGCCQPFAEQNRPSLGLCDPAKSP